MYVVEVGFGFEVQKKDKYKNILILFFTLMILKTK